MLVDSHCHLDLLDLPQLGGSLDAVIDNARTNAVGRMLCVSITLEDFPRVLALANAREHVYASVGVHPNERDGKEPSVEDLVGIASAERKVIAIGETGLDYFRGSGDMGWQRERFRRHIAAARRTGLPLIIHMRDATADTLDILREEDSAGVKGVMHCFTGDLATALAAIELGFYISFSGIVTFNSAADLRAVAASIPEEYLLVETDSPYLAPVPHRGKPNQPGYVRFVAECIAGLRGVPVERIAQVTTENFARLFNVRIVDA
ncbi:MAG: TatD family hydrolase [Gammaproteobacteria bacterium]|nr:TatD family hydrolase [Gammaproteobacteria bacterium]